MLFPSKTIHFCLGFSNPRSMLESRFQKTFLEPAAIFLWHQSTQNVDNEVKKVMKTKKTHSSLSEEHGAIFL